MTERNQLLLSFVSLSPVLSGTGTRIVLMMPLAYLRMTTSFTMWWKQLYALQQSGGDSSGMTRHSAELSYHYLFTIPVPFNVHRLVVPLALSSAVALPVSRQVLFLDTSQTDNFTFQHFTDPAPTWHHDPTPT